MNAQEYKVLAMRTQKDVPAQMRMNNGILGLFGELGEIVDILKKHIHQGHELNAEHLIKECGDAEWYIAQICDVFGWNMPDSRHDTFNKKHLHNSILYPMSMVGKIAYILHGVSCKPENTTEMERDNVFFWLSVIHGFIVVLSEYVGSNIQDVWQTNIDKLVLRYPNGFSQEASVNRVV